MLYRFRSYSRQPELDGSYGGGGRTDVKADSSAFVLASQALLWAWRRVDTTEAFVLFDVGEHLTTPPPPSSMTSSKAETTWRLYPLPHPMQAGPMRARQFVNQQLSRWQVDKKDSQLLHQPEALLSSRSSFPRWTDSRCRPSTERSETCQQTRTSFDREFGREGMGPRPLSIFAGEVRTQQLRSLAVYRCVEFASSYRVLTGTAGA